MLVLYLAISALVAFANSVSAATTTPKSPSTKTKKSQTTIKSNNSSSKCYDDQGNIIPCKMSPTTRIIVGVLVGIAGLIILITLVLLVRKKIKSRKKMEGTSQPEASEEAAAPIYPSEESPYNGPDQKQDGGMAESEKPQDSSYSTPDDPPPQQYAHHSDASGDNVPAFTSTQPEDHSSLPYYNSNITIESGSSAQQYYSTNVIAEPATYPSSAPAPHQ